MILRSAFRLIRRSVPLRAASFSRSSEGSACSGSEYRGGKPLLAVPPGAATRFSARLTSGQQWRGQIRLLGELLALIPGLWSTPSCGPAPVKLEDVSGVVTLSEPHRLYEAGKPISLTVTLFNPSDRPVLVGDGITGGRALELLDSRSGRIEAVSGAVIAEPGPTVAPRDRATFKIDPGKLLPALSVPGDYMLTVVYPHFRSNTVRLRIVPPFSPDTQYQAAVETDVGSFTLEFFPDVAPGHVRNFVNLARTGFYDKIFFHRIVPDVLIQAGDPTGTGTGGPGYTIPAEFNDRPHRAGTLSMARGPDPNSAGSQWFICLKRVPDWDGQYTVFGKVVAGMDVVRKIGRSEVKDEIPVSPIEMKRIVISEKVQKGRTRP